MAKNNRSKGKPRPAGGAQSTAPAVSKIPRAPAVSKANGEVHVKVPSTHAKAAAVMQQPTEPTAAPVTQVPPAKPSTIDAAAEEWADPLADNSSYATADSDDPLSAANTPPAVASTDAVDTRVVPDAPVAWPDLSDMAVSTASTSTTQTPAAVQSAPKQDISTPTEPGAAAVVPAGVVPCSTPSHPAILAATSLSDATPAAVPAAVSAPASAAAAGTGFRPFDMADEVALVKPAGVPAAGESAISWGQCLDWLLCAYTYPVYLTAGVTVGLVQGLMDQLPHTSKAQRN